MSHRLATHTKNLSCHTDGKLKLYTDAKTKFVTQTRKLNSNPDAKTVNLYTDAKTKLVAQTRKLKLITQKR